MRRNAWIEKTDYTNGMNAGFYVFSACGLGVLDFPTLDEFYLLVPRVDARLGTVHCHHSVLLFPHHADNEKEV